nr:PRC-barrel domain-containing protein [Tatlockia sp.]
MDNHSDSIVRTEDVIGKEVKSVKLENLGEIEEIVLDKVSGQARYVVLSFGGFMGLG